MGGTRKVARFSPDTTISFYDDEIVAICKFGSDELHMHTNIHSISANAWKSEPIPNAYNSELSNHFLAVDYSKELIYVVAKSGLIELSLKEKRVKVLLNTSQFIACAKIACDKNNENVHIIDPDYVHCVYNFNPKDFALCINWT